MKCISSGHHLFKIQCILQVVSIIVIIVKINNIWTFKTPQYGGKLGITVFMLMQSRNKTIQ
jgi:hypothetical protein